MRLTDIMDKLCADGWRQRLAVAAIIVVAVAGVTACDFLSIVNTNTNTNDAPSPTPTPDPRYPKGAPCGKNEECQSNHCEPTETGPGVCQ